MAVGSTPIDVLDLGQPTLAAVPDDLARASSTSALALRERRRCARLVCQSVARIGIGPWYRRRWVIGMVDNLNPAGLSIRLTEPVELPVGSTVRLSVALPPPPPPFDRRAQPVTCQAAGIVVWSRTDEEGGFHCGMRLPRLIHECLELQGWEWQRVMFLLAAVALAAVIMTIKGHNMIWFWYEPWFQFYSIIVTLYICSRAFLSLWYRPPTDRGCLPSVTMVIAVKNEEAHIASTIQHCFRLHYPPELFEVLVIDDGSTDQTWAQLTSLRESYPRLRIHRFPKNLGKRHAMALGAQESAGEILVYIDSDSYVEPDGVYRIVQGFADPRVGAVAGHVRVIIEERNPISKMESVRYFVSHRVMKAAESLFGCVTCCSGAFSAYRKSAVLPVLQPWLNQTFLGTVATFGDDRSLTNFVLRRFRVIFCESARCWTYVPGTWSKYFRQQLRWKKSWTREALIASGILYKKSPIAALAFYAGTVLTLCAPFMVIRNMVILPLLYSTSFLPYVAGLVLVYLFFCCIYLYYTRASHWYYGLAFAGLYVGVLCWQNYYAMATVSKTHWGTR